MKEQLGLDNKTQFTEGEIEELKKKYGKIIPIDLADEEDNIVHTFLFRASYPNKKEIMLKATNFLQQKQTDKYIDAIINNSLINGKNVLAGDDDIYLALMPMVDKLFTQYRAALGKR